MFFPRAKSDCNEEGKAARHSFNRAESGEPYNKARRMIDCMKQDLINLVRKTGKKYVVALSASANRGKTSILLELVDIFRANKTVALVDMAPMLTAKDEMWCFEMDGIRIGVVTGGDDAKAVDMGFDFADRNDCRILFCATRYYSNSPSWQQFLKRCSSGGYAYDWQTVKQYSEATLEVMHRDVAENVLLKML